MRTLVIAVRGYSVSDGDYSFLCLQIQEATGRVTIFRVSTKELPTMLSYINAWTDAQPKPTDVSAANASLEALRIRTEGLPTITTQQAEKSSIIDASRFGAENGKIYFDIIFTNEDKREFLFDLIAAQALAASIEDHLSVAKFIG